MWGFFLTLGWSETWEAMFHVSPHTHCNHVCLTLSLLACFSASYWQPGNDGPPHVINGHNYVIEEWSAVGCK